MSKPIDIFECLDLSEGAAESRVDREAGVIRGVKLLEFASYPGVILFFLFLTYVMSGLLRRFSRIRAVSNMLSRTGRPAA